jgi:tetratricopeptide (TPR) repeat protein
MRLITTLILTLTLISNAKAQTVAEKIALNACKYLDSIDSITVLRDSIQPSITTAAANVMSNGTDEERKLLGTVEGIRGTLREAVEILPRYCYNVRKLIIEDKKSKFYKRSGNQQANEYFDIGNNYMERDDYKNAIKAFKSALDLDNNFVYAIDNLAISYRSQEDYNDAIKCYKKSLEIFPEGDVALLNIAVCYSLVNDDENSIKYYNQLKYLFPNDPEGYFGLAKMLFIKADYEAALDNTFIAHRIYYEKKSDYIKDSEQLMWLIYAKLKELNKSELFDLKAKENNITIKK